VNVNDWRGLPEVPGLNTQNDLQQRLNKALENNKTVMQNIDELKIFVGSTLVGWDWTKPVELLQAKARDFWVNHGAMRGDMGIVIGIKRTGHALEESLRSCGLPCHSDILYQVKYPDGFVCEGTDNIFNIILPKELGSH
jgi:hypothetical protein